MARIETVIETRARAFTGRGIEPICATVDGDGRVRVYDSVAGHFTLCHSLAPSAERRIRRLAQS